MVAFFAVLKRLTIVIAVPLGGWQLIQPGQFTRDCEPYRIINGAFADPINGRKAIDLVEVEFQLQRLAFVVDPTGILRY